MITNEQTLVMNEETRRQFEEYLHLLEDFMKAAGLDRIEDPQIIPYEIQEMNPFKEK